MDESRSGRGNLSGSVFSRFFKGTLAVGFSRVSLIIFGLITVVIAVRYIPPSEYGAFVLLQVSLSFLVGFTSFGLSLATPHSLVGADGPVTKRQIINTTIWFRVLVSIAAGVLILVFRSGLNGYIGPSIWSMLLLYLPLLLGLAGLEATFETILQGLFQFTLIGFLGTIGIVSNLILTYVFIVYLRLGVLGLIYAKLIPIAVQLVVAGVYAKLEYRFELNTRVLWKMLVFGLPLQLQYIMDFVFSRIDTIIIASFLGTSGTAFFEVARKIPDSLMALYDAFHSVYFPMLTELHASDQREKANALMNTSVRGLSFIVFLGAIISVAFGKDIVVLLFSSRYLAVYPLFVLLMVGLSLNGLENTLGYSLIAIGEPDKPLIVNIVRASISSIGNLFLVPAAGLLAAALVRLFSNAMVIPLDMFYLGRRNVFVTVRAYVKPLIVCAAASAVFFLLPAPSYIAKVGAIGLYGVCCWLLAIITKEDFLALVGESKAVVFKLGARYRNGI